MSVIPAKAGIQEVSSYTAHGFNLFSSASIYVALIHHPVYNKSGVVVTTAITNLDLHDIARTSRTFGLGGYYVVNPMQAQRELAGRILAHWVTGFGSEYNPNRGEALGRVEVVAGLEDVMSSIEARHGIRPKLVATAARDLPDAVGYGEMKEEMADGGPYVLCFGTGWGLTEEFIEKCDRLLRPIKGPGEYNHLPVRGAVAIILDRLLGDRA